MYFFLIFLLHPMNLSQYLENTAEGLALGSFVPQILIDHDPCAKHCGSHWKQW